MQLPTDQIPGPRRLSIFRGVTEQLAFLRDPIAYMRKLRASHGNLVRLHTRFSMMLFGFGPEYNRPLNTETDHFISRPFLQKGPTGSAQEQLTHSLFSLNHQRHKDTRHAILPAFQKSILNAYHADVVRVIEQKTSAWRNGARLDLRDEMHALAWTVAAKVLFGLEDAHAGADMHHAIEDWLTDAISPWPTLFPFNLPFTACRRVIRKAKGLHERMRTILQAKRAAGLNKLDALSALIRTRSEGPMLSEDELVSHALTLLVVAYETTASTLTWTFFLLAMHPRDQADVLDEIAFLNLEAPTFEQQQRLTKVDHVLKESMRILPAVPYSRRKTVAPGALGGYHVPAKTHVVFSHFITHHLPEIYPQPEQFRPERWETMKPTPHEYLPFGAGLRTCVGVSMAPFIIKCALAHILPRWRLTVVPNARIDRTVGISLSPKQGIPIVLSRQDRCFQQGEVQGDIHELVDLKYAASQTIAATRRAAA
jgi:cytochrome P450